MDSNLDIALQSVKSTLETLATDPSFDFNSSSSPALNTKHGVSLLTLKNHALISYLQNSALVLLSQIERSCNSNVESVDTVRNKAIQNTITQRIVLEKGLKGLESKISYQVEKSLRAYAKSKAAAEQAVQKKTEKENNSESASEEDDEEDNGDLLMFKPNPKLLLGSRKEDDDKTSKPRDKSVRTEDSEAKPNASSEKYQPPKISATPFGTGVSAKKASQHKRKNALMEDYLESTSIAPVAEPSIGSTIIDHGRGGVSTARDRRKQKEINDYEENNYTRLSSITRKQQEKEKKKKRSANSDSFFGEDWGFSGSSNVESATSKKKNTSLWDRAKKRRRG